MNTSEKWAPIVGYEGLYEVSDLGRVKSHHGRSPVILNPVRKTDGYMAVNLCGRHGRRMLAVHRLVLAAFAGPVPAGYEASHLDGVRSNNALANLRYEPHAANCRRRRAHGTQARNTGNAKLKAADIPVIRKLIAEGVSQSKVGAQFGVSRGAIVHILRGNSWVNPELTG